MFIIVQFVMNSMALAQKPTVDKDSIKVYSEIERYAKRNKVTKYVYNSVFRSAKLRLLNRKRVVNKMQVPSSVFNKKIIRYIHIETLDPFGYSIDDTSAVARNFLSKAGNKVHLKSQTKTIRNLLLIKQNQQFDVLKVKESERLVRSMSFISNVSFFVNKIPKNDSVDIYIRVLDSWSIIPKVSTSTTGTEIRLTDENFMGLGHEFQTNYNRNYAKSRNGFFTNYTVPNFKNTYINALLHFKIDENRNIEKSININRPFFSPLAKWAAGVNVGQYLRHDFIAASNSAAIAQRFKHNIQDVWVGSSIPLHKGDSENDRSTNFVSAAQFLRIRYLEKPLEAHDPLHFYANENRYLLSLGVSRRMYKQDKYIFNFGITEDVPIGNVFSLTTGVQKKNNSNLFYLGTRVSFGNYHPWGYLASNFEYGSYYNSGQAIQGVVDGSVNYFTDLFEIGKWKFRQFVKPRVTIGINRLINDSLTINDGYGLDGFNSASLSGNSRFLLAFQTQTYSPLHFIGFRFAPYFVYSVGMLGNATDGFKNSQLYSQIGLGVLIRNEKLVINTFQISIAFYPTIPGNGQNIFKINAFRTTDFGFKDFEIGKPSTVVFR